MAKKKKKKEFENTELVETFVTSFDTVSESTETFENSVENNVENSVETLEQVLESVEDVKNVKPSSKYKVGNIINIKGIPYIVYNINNGMYTLMSFNNKNVIEIEESKLIEKNSK